MWIEDRSEIDNFEEIIDFINTNNEFHDMRIGGLDFDSEQKKGKILLKK